ncbi:Asp23/Gls24 family envelope stress response protein [Streptomyces sp. LP11]|uniref:Asp23/Gls24 family envelope stress response protein n=1 Tax=Streptomyces pyxinicus TaxID=2970331 RepID=A0ABT2BBF1_9ACTN|nr:Asp23/Gls24 family envelope stress response protein [Streptomyces sp. LP11]MCS0605845.1 Asp23/Gls24 family envelope stress response protein [Streptomyces sp. LP11]
MTTHTDPPDTARDHGDDEHLPCGRLLSQVWDDWERGTADPHRAGCPHCRGAVSDLDALETAVRGLREETPGPRGHDAEPLARRVMDLVRLELRPGRPLPLGEPAEDLWITETVAARALRAAAETVDGVRAGSCRLTPAEAPENAPKDSGVGIRLDIHAPPGAVLPLLAERVRQRVRETADRELGMPTAAVDIRVTDLVDDTPADDQEGRIP